MNRLQRSSSGLGDHVAGRLVDREAGGRLEHPSYSYPTDVQRLMIEIDRLPVIDTTATPYTGPSGEPEAERRRGDDPGDRRDAPRGSVLVTFAIDERDGITIGEPFGDTDNSWPFVIIDTGGGAIDSAQGHDGYETVTGLSATMICFEIDYRDDVKSISGTVGAPIVPTS